jgi:hypothetical protein
MIRTSICTLVYDTLCIARIVVNDTLCIAPAALDFNGPVCDTYKYMYTSICINDTLCIAPAALDFNGPAEMAFTRMPHSRPASQAKVLLYICMYVYIYTYMYVCMHACTHKYTLRLMLTLGPYTYT